MTQSGAPSSSSRQWQPAIVCAAAVALVFKIMLALRTYGTNDAYSYEEIGIWSRQLGVQIYKTALNYGTFFNHPPSTIHAFQAMVWLAHASGLPFVFWLRLPGILADAGSLWLLWKLFSDGSWATAPRNALLRWRSCS
jgi:hypothetical protein